MNSEQLKLANSAFLSGAIVSGATVLCIRSSPGWPTNTSGLFRVQIDSEILLLQGGTGPTYNIVTEGMEGSTIAAHNDWAAAMHVITPQGVLNTTGSVNAQTGTSYSIGTTDARALVTFSNGSAIAVTLPQATTGDVSNFGPHFWFTALNLGAGTVTVTPTTSTINGAATLTLLTNQGAIIFSDGTNYFAPAITGGGSTSTVYSGNIGSGQVGWPHLASGAVRSGHIGNTAIVSGSYSSGSIFGFFLSSGTSLSGHLGDNSVNSGNISSGQLSWVHFASGAVRSGNVAATAINSGNISSGVISPFHLFSPAVLSGHIGSGAVVGQAGGGFFNIASGTISTNDIGSGSILSGLLGSGVIGRFHVASGQFAGFELGSGAIVSGRIASGQVGFGHLANASVQSGTIQSGSLFSLHMQSGTIFAGDGISVTIYASGITVANTSGGGGGAGTISGSWAEGVCDIRLSLNSEMSVPISGDIVSQSNSSGRTTSGSTILFMTSGIVALSGITVGMIVVGSGISSGGGYFIVSTSGHTSIELNKAATESTSGASIQFIAGAVYALGDGRGQRIGLYNGTNWVPYEFTSGPNSRILLYDNRQVPLFPPSGAGNFNAKISGLTDTFQLVPGMVVVMSGYFASGTLVSTIDGATNITVSANNTSGGPLASGTPTIFMLPSTTSGTAGGINSGSVWDIFATLRSGVPWLQFSNRWLSGNNRTDPLIKQNGVLVNSGAIN